MELWDIDPTAFDDYEALMAHTRARMVRCTGRAARLLRSVKEEGQHPKDLSEVG